ncbi:hypothetical protein HGI30_06040 [Paenibacillus albicereus]|uniref:ABC transporter permease n=1 Tax=Paenibacillus albicereus TaxID=2726185 RepID=A0A6H2GUT5_9BACL|nr:ABC-2 family transporter protein [Paenibacillus albicereus]QJC51167.1 hypothetical protein HGI30_06040 [Paenibacillus albicereus]
MIPEPRLAARPPGTPTGRRTGKYAVAFRIGFQSALEYRLNFLLSLVSAFFPVAVQYYIWKAVYGGSGRVLFGYRYEDMILYTVMAGIVTKLVLTGIEHSIADDIKSGGLNKYLVQPVGYFGFRLSSYVGQRAASFTILLLLAAGAALALGTMPGQSGIGSRFLLFLPSLLLACALSFLVSYAICACAFWLQEIGYFFVVSTLLVTIVSGGIFPLEVYGETAKQLIAWTPFYYLIYFPVNVLGGRIAGADAWTGMAAQALWTAGMLAVALGSWRLGMKRYLGLGG